MSHQSQQSDYFMFCKKTGTKAICSFSMLLLLLYTIGSIRENNRNNIVFFFLLYNTFWYMFSAKRYFFNYCVLKFMFAMKNFSSNPIPFFTTPPTTISFFNNQTRRSLGKYFSPLLVAQPFHLLIFPFLFLLSEHFSLK